MSVHEPHRLLTAERRMEYPNLQALYNDCPNQLKDGEEFSIVDETGNTIVDGVWHPMTPSRFT
jgi:hypothetical protein